MYKKLTLQVPARLHLTLLAMHVGEYRMNGGIGFAIDKPNSLLSFTASECLEITDQRATPLDKEELKRLFNILVEEQNRYAFTNLIRADISGLMLGHSGFGSGTAITLACLEALHIVNQHTVTQEALIQSSGRGGTSGVGVHTYFNGGLVFDLGKPIDSQAHLPSHQVQSPVIPLLLSQIPMPDWEIGLCIPKNISIKTQAEEREFFRQVCPISAESAYETTYHTLFGLYAAIKEQNKASFCTALKAVQQCTWKRLEREEYGQALIDVESALYTSGAEAVGMSSLGPSLFFLANDVTEVIKKMQNKHLDCDLFLTKPVNHGRQVQDV